MAEKTAILLVHAKAATPLARELTRKRSKRKPERERAGGIELRRCVGHGDLAGARGRTSRTPTPNEFVYEQQNSNHAYYASALKLVNKQLAALSPKQKLSTAGLALQDRAQSLGVLAELQERQRAGRQGREGPDQPVLAEDLAGTRSSAGCWVCLLGLGLAFLLERLDRRIREPKDLEAIYGLPLLGVVPESKALSRSARARRR